MAIAPSRALLAATLLLTVAPGLGAQTTRDQRVIDSLALSSFGRLQRSATRSTYFGKTLLLAPVIMRATYVTVTGPDSVRPLFRDSTEYQWLARALGGIAARRSDIAPCVGPSPAHCPYTPDSVLSVAIGEPLIAGDTATVFLRIGQVDLLGDARLYSGPGLALYGTTLLREQGVWVVRCTEWVSPTEFARPHWPRVPLCSRGRG